ncbi:hypothetical protein ES707_18606 [subsurface metagenome]
MRFVWLRCKLAVASVLCGFSLIHSYTVSYESSHDYCGRLIEVKLHRRKVNDTHND